MFRTPYNIALEAAAAAADNHEQCGVVPIKSGRVSSLQGDRSGGGRRKISTPPPVKTIQLS